MMPAVDNASTALLLQLAVVSLMKGSSPFAVANLDTHLLLKLKFAISVMLELTLIHSSLNVLPVQALPAAAHTDLTDKSAFADVLLDILLIPLMESAMRIALKENITISTLSSASHALLVPPAAPTPMM